MSTVFTYIKPYRFFIIVALFLLFIELIVELIQPLFMAKIINDGIMQEDLSVVLYWGGIMVGMSFFAFIAGIINSFFAAHVSQNYGYDIRKHLYEKVQAFSFAQLNRFSTSSLITRMTNDITQIQTMIFMSLRIMLRAPLIVLGGTIMAFLVNPQIAMMIIIAVPILLLFLIWVLKKGRTLFALVQIKLDGVNKVMRENLTGIRIIKALLRRQYEEGRFKDVNDELRGKTVSALRLMEITMPLLLLIMNLSILGVLWFGSIGVANGNANVGEVVAVVNYATRITAAFSIFSMIIMMFSRGKASASRVSEVLDTKIEKASSTEASASIMEGEIEFNNVSFNYPEMQEPVLKNISFLAEPGKTVAILGATGSGKSSLFQLIPQLYDITNGKILIDGTDIQNIAVEHLRKQIGYVPQDVLLFTGTVKENILWGKEDASMEEVIDAAKMAKIHDAIMRMPNDYETVVGQKGVNLSGGQKQRISIARALIRQPRILLLDDSTSALDLKTEASLLDNLKRYTCTTMIITQKISTAMVADKVLLLEDGNLIAQGNHQQLLLSNSLYQDIYKSQFGEEHAHHV
ncbi:ABC transporter ATP-binding protein [Bacillus sp. FJAT-45350]|uniref:ABC transporter ATP-binding protein n=1 Tax=Bacillus sp. FJAT-45350 TaxID=2011014 RepID=UPI000BB8F9D5|nr:ABC transporter ATP-binding protein [Bacillus sp. FJAT-45350]